jgi:hypothetical protein
MQIALSPYAPHHRRPNGSVCAGGVRHFPMVHTVPIPSPTRHRIRSMGYSPDITQHRACVNGPAPRLHRVCTDLALRDSVARSHRLTLAVGGDDRGGGVWRKLTSPLECRPFLCPLSDPHDYRSIIAYCIPGTRRTLGPGGSVHQFARWRG